jgi:hypothetical protein
LGLTLNSSEPLFDGAGHPLDPQTQDGMRIVAAQVFEFAQRFTTHRARDGHAGLTSSSSPSFSDALVGE